MKKKLWRKIRIGNTKWRIFMVKNLARDTGYDGITFQSEFEIFIEASLKGLRFKHVVLHEIRHAHHMEIGLQDVLDHQAQEMDCQSFATFVASLGVKF